MEKDVADPCRSRPRDWLWKLLRATIRVVCSGSVEFPQSLNILGLSYSPCEDSIGLNQGAASGAWTKSILK